MSKEAADENVVKSTENHLPGLSNLSLFKGFSKESLKVLIHSSKKRRVGRGDFIFRQGDEANSLVYLVAGSAVELLGAGAIDYSMKHHAEDSTICESNLLIGGPRVSSLLAMEDCEVVEFFREGLRKLESAHGKEFNHLHTRLGKEFGETAEKINRKLNNLREDPFIREEELIWSSK